MSDLANTAAVVAILTLGICLSHALGGLPI